MVANTKGMKRKSLAVQNTSPKKAPKVTSISANNTPAKQRKGATPAKVNRPAKLKNVIKPQTPAKGKQKKAPPKVPQSDDDDEEDSSDNDEIEMGEDSDMDSDMEEADFGEEEDSVDEEEESEDDEAEAEEEEKPVVQNVKSNDKNKNKKPKEANKKIINAERVSRDDAFVLFVGHLNFKTTEDEVRQHFRKAGVVVGVNLAKFRNDVSRGFGFVQMKDEAGFKKALKLHHSTLGEMQINVELSKKKSVEPPVGKVKPKSKPKMKKKKNAEA